MSALINFFTSSTAQDLARTLLHTLWQASLAGVLLLVYLKVAPSRRPGMRYLASLAALAFVLLAGCITFSVLTFDMPQPEPAGGEAGVVSQADSALAVESVSGADSNAVAPEQGNLFPGWLSIVTIVWLGGVLVLLVRLSLQLAGIRKIRRESASVSDPALVALFRTLKQKLAIGRPIGLLVSGGIQVPCVMGIFKPALLLPASILTGTSPEVLEAILAHELMHIRRYDYLVNLCQMLIETLFFFNPAVWWINRQVRIEREACCDIEGARVTSEPAQYAEHLYLWLKTASKPGAAENSLMPAFSRRPEKPLLDRITRLVRPAHRPVMRISWIKLTVLLFVSSAVLFGLWKTTELTVSFAGEILTPRERIEKMAELEESHGKPAFDPSDAHTVSEDEKITVAGRVMTAAGSPLPKSVWMRYHYSRGNSSGSIAGDVKAPLPGGDTASFRRTFSYGTIYVSAFAEGFAPTILGPFQMKPGTVKDDFLLVLDKGSPVTVKVIDKETGAAVPAAKLRGGYHFRPDGYSYTIKLTTDANGSAVVKHARNDVKVTLNCTAEGYEATEFERLTIPEGGSLVLPMRKAKPVTGRVVSWITGKPIEGAELRVQRRSAPHEWSCGRDEGRLLATTDKEGRFTIDTLRSDCTYLLAVKADKFAYRFIPDVVAGTHDLTIRLTDPVVIFGRVQGPLEKLPLRNGKRVISYTCGFTYNDSSYMDVGRYVPIKHDDKGPCFEITDIWGNVVNIGRSWYRLSLSFEPEDLPDTPVIIDLNEKKTEAGGSYHKRSLLITFTPPEGFPPPEGTIRLNYIDPEHSLNGYKGKLVPIVDGQVKADIIAPGKFNYSLADTIGYWFKEEHVPVDEGTDPVTVEVPVYPAGMIYGEVFEADGLPAGNTLVSFITAKKSPLLGKTHFMGVDGKNSASASELETKYSINPLPFGGVYRIVAHRSFSYAVSELITLTEKQPISEVNLRFPQGIAFTGRILLPDDTPAPTMPYRLSFRVKGGHSFSGGDQYTGGDGTFRIEKINPEAQGTYTFRVDPKKDFRPVKQTVTDFTKPLVCRLEKGSAATGYVFDAESGRPISGVQVRAWYFEYHETQSVSENLEAEAKTDKHGFFKISTLKEGRDYKLNFTECRSSKEFRVVGGGSGPVECRVTPYEWSKLKPRKR